MRYNQKGFGQFAALLIVLALGALVAIGLSLGRLGKDEAKTATAPAKNQAQSSSAVRDSSRREHAAKLANSLFVLAVVQKEPIDLTQQGLDKLGKISDPLTNKPYVFNSDQAAMRVGEASFKLSSTCDNKLAGSTGTGLIINGSSGSVAVAIKLESGDYACQSNL